MRSSILKLAGLTAFLFCLAPGISQAATCTVQGTTTPLAFSTGATGTDGSAPLPSDCGLGVGTNDSAGVIDDATGINGAWTDITGQLTLVGETFDGDGLPTSGEWGIDLLGNDYDFIAFVLKDGTTGATPETHWVWFLIDLSGGAACPNGTTQIATPPNELCGEWAMYGNGTNRKGLSHASLYGILDGGGGGEETTEPATLLLLGLGLAGLALTQRRRRRI